MIVVIQGEISAIPERSIDKLCSYFGIRKVIWNWHGQFHIEDNTIVLTALDWDFSEQTSLHNFDLKAHIHVYKVKAVLRLIEEA